MNPSGPQFPNEPPPVSPQVGNGPPPVSVEGTNAPNPYASPVAVRESQLQRPNLGISFWALRFMQCAMLLDLVIGLIMEQIDHETIVFSGALLFLSGIVSLVLALRNSEAFAALLACVAILFPLCLCYRIASQSMTPRDSDIAHSMLILLVCWPMAAMTLVLLIYSIYHSRNPVAPTADSPHVA
ncbi:MAG: hypothetical protein AAFP90_15835 [Planctomycetota bacterium]